MVGSRGGWEKRKSVKKKRGKKEEEPERKREMAEEREGQCQERGKDGEEKREETPQRSLVVQSPLPSILPDAVNPSAGFCNIHMFSSYV